MTANRAGLASIVALSVLVFSAVVARAQLQVPDFKSNRPTPRMANGKPDFSGYWKGTTDTKPVGNIGKDLPGWKLPLTPAGEAALKHNLTATVDPEAGYKGITAFIVEKQFEGFSVGKKEDKLGIRASSTTELILDNCKVPKENVLGEVGKGYKVSIETLNEGRIGIGAQMLGIAQGAYEAALKYTQEREQFGRPISDFQAVQFQLAEMAVEIEATRLLVYNAARLKDAGKPFLKEAAIAKLYSSRCAEAVSSKAIELYGGYGYVKDYPVEKYWRDSKIGAIYEGTSNMQLQTIAKLITSGK